MRHIKRLLAVPIVLLSTQILLGAAPITVQQLQELLRTAKNSRRPDLEVTRKLSSMEMTERLSDARLQELLRISSGPRTSAALQLMADKSVFEPAPKSDWVDLPEPSAEEQSAILARIRQYASRYVQSLPNYLVTAEIRRFDDDPALSAEKRPLWHQLRARDHSINQLRYSDGQESYSAVKVSGTPKAGGGGLKTVGEFAGIFAALFAPDSGVTVQWDHWETIQGAKAAVFGYSVPALHSRFTVVSGELHINPGYRGRLFADPDSGAVLRMTRQADDQPPSFPTRRSDTSVEYAPVRIGDSSFLLPARSVTFSEVTGPRIVSQVLPHYPFTRSNILITSPTDYLNETLYSNYLKFGADSKLVFADGKPEADPVTADAGADSRAEPADAELNLGEATPESAGPNVQPDEKVTPTFQASAKLVEVSVVARDEKGRLIRDLKQRDFAVFDGDKPQQIRLFKTNESPSREPSTQAPQAAQSEQSATVSNHGLAASHQGAINVILFDELNTVWVDQVDARNQVIKFLSQMNPKERIGLYLLTPWGPQILQDITTDSSELVQILASRTSGGQVLPSFTKGSHPSDITLGLARWVNGQDRGFRWSQLQGSPDPLTAAANAPLFNLMNSLVMLKAVINHLAGVPGRKNLIWISANLPDFTAADSNRILSGAMRVAVDANVSIYPIDARGVIADPGYSAAEREAPVPWALRSSVVRYNSTLATMLDAASKTGGRASISNGDISGAIRSAIDDSHFTYTLGFYPESLKYDGTYHSLTVKVKERPKITLLYRPGYMDARPVENVEKELSDALWSPLDASGIGLTANLSPAQSGGCEVRVVIDAEALVLLHKEDRWTGKIDVSMAQKDEEGSLYDREDQNIVPNVLPKTYRDMLDHGFTYNHVFARNANATCLRVVVHDQGSGNLGSVTVPLKGCETVPAALSRKIDR